MPVKLSLYFGFTTVLSNFAKDLWHELINHDIQLFNSFEPVSISTGYLFQSVYIAA